MTFIKDELRKVLIVDDQSDIRRLVRLVMPGTFQILEAASADGALEIIQREQIDILILDVMMPGTMDGYELCKKIKQDKLLSEIFVVMVTARGQDEDRNRGKEVGANEYFVKPFSPLALIRLIEKVPIRRLLNRGIEV